jgi:hypothetical protein
MFRCTLIGLTGLCAAFASSVATAGSLYLNGVNIDGVTAQKFEKCSVRIDESGNVFIDAPGYAAKVVQGGPAIVPAPAQVQAPPPAPPPVTYAGPIYQPYPPAPYPPPNYPPPVAPRITKRYFLAVEQTAPGMTEYDIDVYLNAKWLMTLKNETNQEAQDITRYFVPGKNTVTLEARKVSTGPRRSFSKEHAFNVVVGEGNEGGGRVFIDNALVRFTRTAADTNNVSQDYTITAR